MMSVRLAEDIAEPDCVRLIKRGNYHHGVEVLVPYSRRLKAVSYIEAGVAYDNNRHRDIQQLEAIPNTDRNCLLRFDVKGMTWPIVKIWFKVYGEDEQRVKNNTEKDTRGKSRRLVEIKNEEDDMSDIKEDLIGRFLDESNAGDLMSVVQKYLTPLLKENAGDLMRVVQKYLIPLLKKNEGDLMRVVQKVLTTCLKENATISPSVDSPSTSDPSTATIGWFHQLKTKEPTQVHRAALEGCFLPDGKDQSIKVVFKSSKPEASEIDEDIQGWFIPSDKSKSRRVQAGSLIGWYIGEGNSSVPEFVTFDDTGKLPSSSGSGTATNEG